MMDADIEKQEVGLYIDCSITIELLNRSIVLIFC